MFETDKAILEGAAASTSHGVRTFLFRTSLFSYKTNVALLVVTRRHQIISHQIGRREVAYTEMGTVEEVPSSPSSSPFIIHCHRRHHDQLPQLRSFWLLFHVHNDYVTTIPNVASIANITSLTVAAQVDSYACFGCMCLRHG